jgi:hypothetical protein
LLPELEAKVQQLWDLEEIRRLAYRYAYSVDFRDVEMYRSLWSRRGVEPRHDEIDGRVAERMIEQWPGRGPSILAVCNHLIDLESAEEASGSVLCLVQVQLGDEFADQSIMYRDRYVKEDGAWRFLVRRHLLWFGEMRADNPLRQAPAEWPERQVGVGTLPGEIGSYREFVAASKKQGNVP